MAAELNRTDSFVLQGWMVTDLQLEGGELITYALVHQFTQSNAGRYMGGPGYIAAWLGCTTKTARNYLHSLVEKELILTFDHEINCVTFRDYRINFDPLQNFQGYGKNFPTPGKNFPQMYNRDNKDTNVSSLSTAHARGSKAFVAPSVEEVAAYCRERGNAVDAQTFVDFYKAKGWKIGNAPMRDWQPAVRTWERRPSHTPTPELRRTPSPAQRKFDSMIQAGIELGIIKPQTTEYDEQ